MTRTFSRVLLGLCLVLPSLLTAPASGQVTLPDTTCASAVGVGPGDIPHAYVGVLGASFSPTYACPDHYPGENGFGVNGALLFARQGPSAFGGEGVICYGNGASPLPTGHHGSQTTINVRDDRFGGAVGFTVMADWNRTEDNPILPSSNNAGFADCGDRLIEPCPLDDPSAYTTLPGCNPLDFYVDIFPQSGLCDAVTLSCTVPPGPNSWTSPVPLADLAGADGALTVLVWMNVRADLNHAGAATTGAVWTD